MVEPSFLLFSERKQKEIGRTVLRCGNFLLLSSQFWAEKILMGPHIFFLLYFHSLHFRWCNQTSRASIFGCISIFAFSFLTISAYPNRGLVSQTQDVFVSFSAIVLYAHRLRMQRSSLLHRGPARLSKVDADRNWRGPSYSASISGSMSKFLCKFVPFGRHIAIISSVFPENLGSFCFRIPLFFVKFKSTTSYGQSFTVSYLVSDCGISPERAASISKSLHFESREKPDSVIKFFENQGFSHAQALKAVRILPKLLGLDPEKNLLPKIEFLKSKGVLSSDVPRIILKNPVFLARSLEKHIVPSFDFFTNFFHSDEKFITVFTRFPSILAFSKTSVILNINLLRAEGVSESHIIKLLELNIRTLSRAPHQFKAFVEEVKEMGLNSQKVTFVKAISILTGISKSTWARKSSAFKRWGWTDDEILAAFRTLCMTLSENMIDAKLEFFVNKMGCKSSTIARRPLLLSFSLDKRIIPRGSIIQVLLSKGLVSKLSLCPMFECSETVFLERYILHHEKEAEELLTLYRAKLGLARCP